MDIRKQAERFLANTNGTPNADQLEDFIHATMGKVAAGDQVEDSNAVVLYFETKEMCDDFADMIQQTHSYLTARTVQ